MNPTTAQDNDNQQERTVDARSESPDMIWGDPNAGWWRIYGYAVSVVYTYTQIRYVWD